jgi:hypothetical protein
MIYHTGTSPSQGKGCGLYRYVLGHLGPVLMLLRPTFPALMIEMMSLGITERMCLCPTLRNDPEQENKEALYTTPAGLATSRHRIKPARASPKPNSGINSSRAHFASLLRGRLHCTTRIAMRSTAIPLLNMLIEQPFRYRPQSLITPLAGVAFWLLPINADISCRMNGR